MVTDTTSKNSKASAILRLALYWAAIGATIFSIVQLFRSSVASSALLMVSSASFLLLTHRSPLPVIQLVGWCTRIASTSTRCIHTVLSTVRVGRGGFEEVVDDAVEDEDEEMTTAPSTSSTARSRSSTQRPNMNQFGLGETDFNRLSFLLLAIPSLLLFLAGIHLDVTFFRSRHIALTPEILVRGIANVSGYVGVLNLSFFLIPVSRHSILLQVMGWSPVHALRLHVWAGFLAFTCVLVHSALYVATWFVFEDNSIWDQLVPGKDCWDWLSEERQNTRNHRCTLVWDNITGVIATLSFVVLVTTSLYWFRRRYYRLFYTCHVLFGTGMLLAAICHWLPMILYVMPSILYYLCTTVPTLTEAVESWMRRGVEIVAVIPIGSDEQQQSQQDGGGSCALTEVRIATDGEANLVLDREACLFVKLCIPSISLVWHPFTVYKHSDDPTTVRILFRGLGPFTKKATAALLLRHLESNNTTSNRNNNKPSSLPVTLVDGFYRGGDRVAQALQHDHVTIACGGVAITPFLSTLPALIAKMKDTSVAVRPRRLVVHWACREDALIRFVCKNYLNGLVEMAQGSVGVEAFVIHIYHTGDGGACSENKDPNLSVSESASITESTFASVEFSPVSSMTNQSTNNPTMLIHDDGITTGNKKDTTTILQFIADGDARVGGGGHPMKVGRMMPARYLHIWQNLSTFAIGSTILWAGFGLIHAWYDHQSPYSRAPSSLSTTTNAILPRLYSTFATIGLAICISILSGLAANFRSGYQWSPAPQLDLDEESREEIAEHNTSSIVQTYTTSSSTSCIHLQKGGRPSPQTMLADAVSTSNAHAPGVFVCGPSAMVDGIRKEAGQNDSVGGSRFCVYNEPFDI